MTRAGEASVRGQLETLGPDGQVLRRDGLGEGPFEIGRARAAFAEIEDPALTDLAARIHRDDEGIRLEDPGEGTGVWLRLTDRAGRLLDVDDQLWLGAQLLVVKWNEWSWRLHHHGPDGRLVERIEVPVDGLFIGRTEEIALDPEDEQLSRRHAQLVVEADGLRFYDRGAHNGSYLRIREAVELEAGDEFRVSSLRFRYVVPERPGPEGTEPDPTEPAQKEESKPEAGLGARLRQLSRRRQRSHERGQVAPEERVPEESDASPSKEDDEATVVAPSLGATAASAADSNESASPDSPARSVLIVIDSDAGSVSLEAESGATILEAVRAAGLERGEPVDWECGDGGCGVCILGVSEGADRMDPPADETSEMKTIQITEQVAPDPKLYRLACLARVRGTVRLRKLT